MSMRWGLVVTLGAHHLWHIDCNGFATYIDTQTGMKLWFVARPKESQAMDFSSTSLFTEGFQLNAANLDRWDIEAVLLLPGSRL